MDAYDIHNTGVRGGGGENFCDFLFVYRQSPSEKTIPF